KSSRQKRANQWRTWSDQVLPHLVVPYLTFVKDSKQFRRSADLSKLTASRRCSQDCDGRRRRVTLTCVFFDKEASFEACTCSPVSVQLVTAGLFPCAPIDPSLAVDMRLLQFVNMLSLRTPPNVSAWSDTLETLLLAMGYKFHGSNNLRKRFQRSFHWYRVLLKQSEKYLHDQANRYLTAGPGEQPSVYLRERCPLCFGGNDWKRGRGMNTSADVIVCIDACFTQKRTNVHRKGDDRDPPNPCQSVFLSEDRVHDAERLVEKKRQRRAPKRRAEAAEQEDVVEEGMRIPASVLDGCNDSFVAADEKRQKASTKFFSDTGLMALMCRHDRVLWLANMTSAGEKQHYALALIIELFKHLPADMRVGILYDIGCQLERSCRIFNFIPDLLPRISFAISVFHAYGHQWACQIIYHPRKRQGFGFSDGEGCERLWSALKMLISSLRVSGFHQRLFVLDLQVDYLDIRLLEGYGLWLQRRWKSTQQRRVEASNGLKRLSFTDAELRAQWGAQVAAQTRPLPRQSSRRTGEDLMRILELEKSYEKARDDLSSLEDRLASQPGERLIDSAYDLEQAQTRFKRLEQALQKQKQAMGFQSRQKLSELRRNQYIYARLKALALKTRIRDKLRHRKFELSKLERAYRQTMNEQRLHDHAAQSIKRKEPTISQLVKRYNDLVTKLKKMKEEDRSLIHVVLPHFIKPDGIFELDVDDDIWEDVGLHEDEPNPPAWLADNNVREGIRHLLAYDRSTEEISRLSHERTRLQEWSLASWLAWSKYGLMCATDNVLRFHAELHLDKLALTIAQWLQQTFAIPPAWIVDQSWGPSNERMFLAREKALASSMQLSNGAEDDSEVDNNSASEADNVMDELVADAEDMALVDEYHRGDQESSLGDSDSESSVLAYNVTPSKKARSK
ncbi:hypothetical protein CONPUDRAFT_51057, partial [Coniophora puteana RWD-64-598 SS2]